MLVEILMGLVITLAIIAAAAWFAFKTPSIKGPSRHEIRGNGDNADVGRSGFDYGGGGDSGGGD